MLAKIEDEENDDDALTGDELARVLKGEEQLARGESADGDALLREFGL